jgi:polysaccharide biosynthesis protein PslH
MKILHIMPYPPVPPTCGGAIRMHYLLKNIARSHEVTVLSFGDATTHVEFRKYFNSHLQDVHILPRPWWQKHNRIAQLYATLTKSSYLTFSVRSQKMQDMIDNILARNTFDVVQTEFSSMASYRLNTDAVKILDAHNIEHDLIRRMYLNTRSPLRKLYYLIEYEKFYSEKIEYFAKQDAFFVTSERDKMILDIEMPNVPKFIIPNGVDSSYFIPTSESPEPFSLVFTGVMGYLPNYDGVMYFLDKIFPLIQKKIPAVKVYIVGKRSPQKLLKRANDRIIVTGCVDDVRPYISRASVYVVPLRIGGGTRLKVIEAMAMKIPIVTTSIGSEGIDVVNNESALIADEPQSFANAVIELFHNASLRQKLVRNGYELMQSQYEWSVIGRQVENYYQILVNRSRGQKTAGDA